MSFTSKHLLPQWSLPLTRRTLVQTSALTGLGALAARAGAQPVASGVARPSRVRELAPDYSVVYESPDPKIVKSYSPGLCRLDSGRLVATCDLGGAGVKEMSGPKCLDRNGNSWQGRIYTSDDQGRTWQLRATPGIMHARPFVAGGSLYVLGHSRDLAVLRSDDNGTTWSEPAYLTKGEFWHQAPCNVHYDKGSVYLVMERRVSSIISTWYPGELAPVLMRAKVGDDLSRRESWTFASELPFKDLIPNYDHDPAIDFFGVPFWGAAYPTGSRVAPNRFMAPIGWLEANVVQFRDPHHLWHDPEGKTFHLWMRAHTGGTGYAAICKVVENPDGTMTTSLQKAPSGKKMLYVPCPGGQMKFHVLWDEVSQLFWLLSTQATDSMCRPDLMPAKRYDLPNNERRRLQLHFSKNMVDWCFAGLVTQGPGDNAARHYATMIIDGDDLRVLSRSGDERASSAHDGNIITFHTVAKFRELVY